MLVTEGLGIGCKWWGPITVSDEVHGDPPNPSVENTEGLGVGCKWWGPITVSDEVHGDPPKSVCHHSFPRFIVYLSSSVVSIVAYVAKRDSRLRPSLTMGL